MPLVSCSHEPRSTCGFLIIRSRSHTILVYGRRLLDSEFELIKSHPRVGESILEKHGSTRLYKDVALGHHLWYDGSRGYPDDFDAFKSPVKTIIDIVAVADCMDAATDRVGRSYNKGKTLDDYIGEIKEVSGTRYAPWAYELLTHSSVRDELVHILDHERSEIYKETYNLLRHINKGLMNL